MNYYTNEIEKVYEELATSADGLDSAAAQERLAKQGKNKLKEAESKSLGRRFLEQLSDPMTLILLAAAAVSFVLALVKGESFADVIIILAVVLINAALGVFQENKAEKAIEALQEMSAAQSKVLRDGKMTVIHSEDLVPGDVVLFEAGDAVPADARLIECADLKVEEAALTGESLPVVKCTEALVPEEGKKDIPLGDRKNMVYMGSTVVYGRGRAVVCATGMDTEMGRIADALAKAQDGQTPLQIKMAQLSKMLTKLVLGICVVIFAVNLIKAGGFSLETVLDSFMVAVSLAVAAIPEGLAAVVTVVLSIGVTNMAKRSAIIRKLTAVETLGCTQIICTDKTGTLTQNKMTVVDHYGDEKLTALAMALCSDAEQSDGGEAVGEPTEAALVNWAHATGLDKDQLKKEAPRVGEAPFDSGRKMMSTVHQTADGLIQYTKGAPDILLSRCTKRLEGDKEIPITDEFRKEVLSVNKGFADRALRVLGCARRKWEQKPDSFKPEDLECDMTFIGLAAMMDPVRPEVKAAIEECESAGIRPVMITGDHVDTAVAIAKELGIIQPGQRAITGADLDELSDEEFAKQFEEISVYARVQPQHKARIVKAWQDKAYVTGMTGDGVNDAPSIKTADIGIGMGITGTDVTKNVADMVLADDNFATIISAVEEGRRIYDNIRKAVQFLLSSNMSEVLSVFFATIIGFTVLKPVHLLWINLITDCLPALALGMEKAEMNVMARKPRKSGEGFFSGGMGFDIAYQGLLISALVLLSYFIGVYMKTGCWQITDSTEGRTMAFLTMSIAEVFHAVNMRSQRGSIFKLKTRNPMMLIAAVFSFLVTTAVCKIPALAKAFDLSPVDLEHYLIATGLGLCMIPIVECVKAIQRKAGK